MSKNNRSAQSKPATDTMQLKDAVTEVFEPATDAAPEEFVPDSAEEFSEEAFDDAGSPPQYEKAEKALNIISYALSALLVLGSLVFWWYFAGRLSVCPLVVNDYKLYQGMLIGCASVPLVFTVIQALRRRPANAESWMINMCFSGLVTAAAMILYNTYSLGNDLAMNNVLTVLCFSISGCALPAAIYTFIRWIADLLCDSINRAASLDRSTVYADVLKQCEGRF